MLAVRLYGFRLSDFMGSSEGSVSSDFGVHGTRMAPSMAEVR